MKKKHAKVCNLNGGTFVRTKEFQQNYVRKNGLG